MSRFFTMWAGRALVASVLAMVAALTTASTLNAQTPTGTITGRVSDASGLEVPGATVTIASPNLQGVRSTVSSVNGDFIFTSVPPGPYTITVELSGFGTMKQTRDVGAGQPVHVDVTLRPASLSEVVTVNGAGGCVHQHRSGLDQHSAGTARHAARRRARSCRR